jgi:hypothetical protein
LRNAVDSVTEITTFARGLANRSNLRKLPNNSSNSNPAFGGPQRFAPLLLLLWSVRRLKRVASPRGNIVTSETEVINDVAQLLRYDG